MRQCRFESYTKNTITTMEALHDHLRTVRAQGWAIDDEEYLMGHRCIGAPIYDYRGEIIAAISASGPLSLVSDERISEIIEKVQEAASMISRKLCYFDFRREESAGR